MNALAYAPAPVADQVVFPAPISLFQTRRNPISLALANVMLMARVEFGMAWPDITECLDEAFPPHLIDAHLKPALADFGALEGKVRALKEARDAAAL
jgi:hypothetical protein